MNLINISLDLPQVECNLHCWRDDSLHSDLFVIIVDDQKCFVVRVWFLQCWEEKLPDSVKVYTDTKTTGSSM
jgi:hypothetical protein